MLHLGDRRLPVHREVSKECHLGGRVAMRKKRGKDATHLALTTAVH
jgi:hypothetical protein